MCKGQAGKRGHIAALIEKLKKPDNNELLRTVAIPLITAAFAAMAVIIAAHFTSRSTIEAARLAMQNQVNTEKDLGRALYLERSIYRGEPPTKQGETHAVKAYPYADQNSDTTLTNYGEDAFIIEAAMVSA